jgi:large subunit ribosomal protein L15
LGYSQSSFDPQKITMETLSKLNKITQKSARRRGRGIGSGLGGHTAGRGQKGDKARGKTSLGFIGTKNKKSWIKRLPFLKGKNRLQNRKNIVIFNLDQLEKWFKQDDLVDVNSLSKKSKIALKKLNSIVKILSGGKLTKALKFKGVLFSQAAKKKIISANGKID